MVNHRQNWWWISYLLDLPPSRKEARGCSLIAFPAGKGAQSCCWGGAAEMPVISVHRCPRCHVWPTFAPFQAPTETLTFANLSQLLQCITKAKTCLGKKKKKIKLIVQRTKGWFSVPRRKCGPAGEGCFSTTPEQCPEKGTCKFRSLSYYSWGALSSWC